MAAARIGGKLQNPMKKYILFLLIPLSLSTAAVADGKSDYARACSACHNLGVAGAPRVGDPALWEDRLKQGMDTLVEHAINGYSGDSGVMPPKGGFSYLSDEQIQAIVEYMVSAEE